MSHPGYICQHCTSHLDINDKIILAARTQLGKRGIIFLSTTIGDYSIQKNDAFDIPNGEEIDLQCPVCQHALIHDAHKNLCKLIRVDAEGEEHTILFSNKFGEQCTFQIKGEKATSYGEHAIRYQDPEWYLQSDE